MTGYRLKPKEAADQRCEDCAGTGYYVGGPDEGARCACTYPCYANGCEGEPGSECIHCGAIMDEEEPTDA